MLNTMPPFQVHRLLTSQRPFSFPICVFLIRCRLRTGRIFLRKIKPAFPHPPFCIHKVTTSTPSGEQVFRVVLARNKSPVHTSCYPSNFFHSISNKSFPSLFLYSMQISRKIRPNIYFHSSTSTHSFTKAERPIPV